MIPPEKKQERKKSKSAAQRKRAREYTMVEMEEAKEELVDAMGGFGMGRWGFGSS